ncbi:hypothetical protein U1839_04265 [Sphingomonas sp. RT2P30]|uniref:DUF4350 domain-containing protein n=1 Tax=Parasphingomonas halimpatiens TaxID=3096162 RepID=UPI002FC7BF81
MSDLVVSGTSSGAGAFRARTVAIMLAIGILGFAATLLLGAYAPDFRSGNDARGHALSNAAIGFSGIVRLAQDTGRNPTVIRDDKRLSGDALVVLTPEFASTPMGDVLATRKGKPTLIVFPKWLTIQDPAHPGWVRYIGLDPPSEPEGVLAPDTKLTFTQRRSGGVALHVTTEGGPDLAFKAPQPLQTLTGAGVIPIITDEQGGVVFGRIGQLYFLADPDLLNNRGLADAGQARAALALLDYMSPADATEIDFDVTLNGLGRAPNPLKLMFQPPFLPMTLAIVAALLLAGWQAFGQFGAPRRRPRAIAFGKAALIDNAAALVRRARREKTLGGRYADVVRERAAIVFGVPARLRDSAIDAYLDRLGRGAKFTDLAGAARDARDRREVLDAAQALHRWQWEKNA